MSLNITAKRPLVSLPFLKKRLRGINALGLRNLTVNDFSFTVHFTLHRNNKTVAFYTSESIDNQRSPEWLHLRFPVNTQCLQDFVICIWITSLNNCRLFLQYEIHLDDSLLPDDQKDQPSVGENVLWFTMFGYQFTDRESPTENMKNPSTIEMIGSSSDKKSNSKRNQVPTTYNAMSLKRMINIIDAIKKETETSKICLEQLRQFSEQHEKYFSKIKERDARQLRILTMREYIQSESSSCEQRMNFHRTRQKILEEKKNKLEKNFLSLRTEREKLTSLTNQIKRSNSVLQDLVQLTNYRRKELIGEIYRYVYPITLKKDKNEFAIANAGLPPIDDRTSSTTSSRERIHEMTAAVGFCAHFVLLISQFFRLPLRYPIECFGSSIIKIYDNVAQSSDLLLDPNSKTFAFHSALFLLYGDIVQIIDFCSSSKSVPDMKKPLENLKELMEKYVVPPSKKKQSPLLQSSSQSTSQISIPESSISISDAISIRFQREPTSTPVFSSVQSSNSSFIETADLEENEENGKEIELFAAPNSVSPRLAMQFSILQK